MNESKIRTGHLLLKVILIGKRDKINAEKVIEMIENIKTKGHRKYTWLTTSFSVLDKDKYLVLIIPQFSLLENNFFRSEDAKS